MTKRLVVDVLTAAARAQREAEPTYGMLYLAREASELGEPEVAREIVEAATVKSGGAWFALLATVHAMIGARDIEDLAAKALQEPSSWIHGTLASAYERIGDHARADQQIALVKKAQRFATIATVARIALEAGNLERAARLAEQSWARKSNPALLAALKIDLARAYATIGDTTTARRQLEEAEKLDDGSIVERVKAWVALGESQRACDVAASIDKGHYYEIESLTTAEAYAAAGVTRKVDTILAAYAAEAADRKTAAGYAEAALTYLRFGRELGVRKNLKAAEAALATETSPVLLDSGHNSLSIAYVIDKQFAKAIDHIGALHDPEGRALRLLEVARALRDANTESTPELEAAIARLP